MSKDASSEAPRGRADDKDTAYIVVEDGVSTKSMIKRGFDNEEAATSYAEDPEQLGNLFAVPVALESSYEAAAESDREYLPGKSPTLEAEVHFDGGARPNPGPAAIGCTISDRDGHTDRSETIGEATNNQAEYKALIRGLKLVDELGYECVTAKGDSQLVVNQVAGDYDTNDETLKALRNEVRELVETFDQFTIKHVPRERNNAAHGLVDEAFENGE